ncbi:MAG: tRNA uridine-5-carboxymethylaminomethyl(34) synthesis enzyme MnmG, partial [Gammaproteobacteria bacterium]|nr:tRNA uridine-5-carboxymethylaminomethyl(34) synthesis enzyme MnmG [Gammaproteobacteria bacterium]
RDTWLSPESVDDNEVRRVLGQPLQREQNLLGLLRRPEVGYRQLMTLPGAGKGVTDLKVTQQVEIQAKYLGYIERQQAEIERQRRNEQTRLPEGLDYQEVRGLSTEVVQKLSAHKPTTIGQASRISGVTPAAISLLLVHLKRTA